MGYIGRAAAVGQTETVKDSFNGDNSTVAFTMSQSVSLDTDIEVFVGNVQQEPGSGKAYTVSGTTLTFSEAPPTGTANIYVIHRNSLQGTLLPPQNLGDRNYLIGGDLSLDADGAALKFGVDSDITLTHHADNGLRLKTVDTSGVSGIGVALTLQTGDTDIAQGNTLGTVAFQAPDEGTGTDAILVAASIAAVSEGDFSSSNNATKLSFRTAASESAGEKMTLSSGGDLSIVTDGASIFFGADSEIELRHVADDGLILKHVGTGDGKEPSLTFQAGDNDIAQDDVLGSIFFQAPDEGAGTDAVLVAAGIEAVSEGDFSSSSNATKLVFKTASSEAASEKMSLSSAGLLTVADDIVIGDGKTIGSSSDPDAIAIGSDGDVTLTQDLELQHDGAILSFGADDEIQFIHVADTGLVLKHANTADDKFPTFTLQTGDTDIAQGDKLGRIEFQAPDEGAGTDAVLVAAAIEARSEGDFSSSNNATSLLFQTGASETATEKMKITSAGLVGIDTGTIDALSAAKMTINVDNSGGLVINNIGQTNGEHGTIFFASHATSSAAVKQGIGVKRGGDFGVGDLVFAVDSNADSSSVSMGADKKMSIRQQGDLSIQANTSGFSNFTGFGTVTIADESSITLTSGSHAGGANHLFVYETGTGSNCRYYFGYNKSAIETNVEIGGIAFHNGDQDGATCLINDGGHTNTLKNREGSSTTYKLLKVGVGATFNDTAS